MHLAATCKLALLSCNRRNLAEQAEDIVVQLACGLALQAVTPSIIDAVLVLAFRLGMCLILDHAVKAD